MAIAKTVEIDPVTRVEGHGKIVIHLNENGQIEDTFFGVTEFRGFEKLCEGRMLWDMPTIMDRICGFCPVSHHLASVKACESLLGVEPPPAAIKVRELLHMGQIIHSHALHFFFCALPDTLYNEGAPISQRSFFGMMHTNKAIVSNAIKIRKVGQDIVDIVGGGRLHPIACIPGGMSKHLKYFERLEMLKGITLALKIAQTGIKMVKEMYAKSTKTFSKFASFPSLYMGMVKDDNLELYEGPLRVIDENGEFIREFYAKDYLTYIEETVEPTSWTKFTFYKETGSPNRMYRVAPLARINVSKSISTPLAQEELVELKNIGKGKPLQSSLFYHYARMIELLYAVERARELLYDPEILSHEIRVPVKRKGGEGIGVLEAPRGPLIHHYWANEDGKIQKANLIVATEHNNGAMNKSVRLVADQIVKQGQIQEKDMNMLEMAIRCYDPCLSCSSHAIGQMPLEIIILNHDKSIKNRYLYGNTN